MEFDELSLPESSEFDTKLYGLLGQIVVTFNTLEAVLRECVARSLGTDKDLGVVVLSRITFNDLVDMLKVTALFVSKSWPDSVEFEEKVLQLTKSLKQANDQRNRAVHLIYGQFVQVSADDASDLSLERVTQRTRYRRKLEHAVDPLAATESVDSLGDLEDALAQIKQAVSDLYLLSIHLTRPRLERRDARPE